MKLLLPVGENMQQVVCKSLIRMAIRHQINLKYQVAEVRYQWFGEVIHAKKSVLWFAYRIMLMIT